MALRLLAITAVVLAVIIRPIYNQLTVLGLFRTTKQQGIRNLETDVKILSAVQFCEDVHYYAPGDVLFSACENSEDSRFSWYPPIGVFKDPAAAVLGSLTVINPQTFALEKLTLEGFPYETFTTHGIDVIADPADETNKTVLIYAINHLPNPAYVANLYSPQPDTSSGIQASLSQIEVFRHVLGTGIAKYIRSIRHDAIVTPNDVLAVGPESVYVTNDHYHRHGLLRDLEDLFSGAKWSNVQHVQISELDAPVTAPNQNIAVNTAVHKIHNPNGLGHVTDPAGKPTGEIMLTSATSGQLYSARVASGTDSNLTVTKIHQFDNALDNPSYFADPYATEGQDASGYIMAGVTRGLDVVRDFGKRQAIAPFRVYHLKRIISESGEETYRRSALLEDDTGLLRMATTATLTAIDPASNDGKKEGWLWVGSALGDRLLAVKVDLQQL